MTFPVESRSRLIKDDNYVIVVEEVSSLSGVSDMLTQVSPSINGADTLSEELISLVESYPDAPLEFSMLHYYDEFVSPSNFQGCALIMLVEVPDEETAHLIPVELLKLAPEEALGRIFFIAVRHDRHGTKLNLLKTECDKIIQARVKTLRNLQNH